MLLIGQRIDGRNAGERREGLDIGLLEGPDHRAVDHPSEHAGSILDRLTPPELDLAGGEEECVATQFPDADFEADARACGGLGKKKAPAFTSKGSCTIIATVCFQFPSQRENFKDLGC